jgi:hypothetical protein
MDVLTLERCINHITWTLGGSPPAEVSAKALVNEAQEHLVSMHEWKWLERPPVHLDVRARITFTAATWTPTGDVSGKSNVIEKTAAFAGYAYLEGDEVEITAGTGVTLGWYAIRSRISADKIELKTSIGPAATDVAGTMENYGIRLPADFRSEIEIHATQSFVTKIYPTTIAEIVQFRTQVVQITSAGGFWYAIVSAAAASASGGAPVPRLEIWPSATLNDTGGFTLAYLARLPEVSNDQHEISIPSWIHTLFLQILIEMARGYTEEDVAPLYLRLEQIEGSALLRRLKQMDGGVQRSYGPIIGGAARSYFTGRNALNTEPGGPA